MEKGKKSVKSNILIILLILLIIAIAVVGLTAWAKYLTAQNGTTTAQVAKWSFKVVDGIAETSDVIDFAVTRTDNNTSVAEGKLAPGTYGQLEIGIDARGTETILEYVIDLALTNKPTNMKFYADSAKTEQIEIVDGKLVRTGFMSLEDVKEIKTETIYWDWPFLTGKTPEEQDVNDDIDTIDMGKTVTMEISVTGTEVLEEPIKLIDVIQLGDYVNYNASSNGIQTFTNSDCVTGGSISSTFSTDDNFSSSTPAQWRVLSIDRENGKIELMSVEPTAQSVTLSNKNGFVNAEVMLNKVCSIYGKGKGAVGARSMIAEDIEQHSSFVKTNYYNAYSNTRYYGGTRDYTSGNFFRETKDAYTNAIEYATTLSGADSSNPARMTQTYYYMDAFSYFSNMTIFNTIFRNSSNTEVEKATYWLASKCVQLDDSYCNFGVRVISDNDVTMVNLYKSYGSNNDVSNKVVPVVYLDPNILISGQDENGVWQLKVD